jgi:hypothetical protein
MSHFGILQNTKWQSCIDACMKCAEACEFCATRDVKEQSKTLVQVAEEAASAGAATSADVIQEIVKMMASCVQINRECAAVCWTSAALMSMDSLFAKQFCSLCADVCDACAKECERHGLNHSKRCAQVCRICAEECRRTAK